MTVAPTTITVVIGVGSVIVVDIAVGGVGGGVVVGAVCG